MAIASIISWHKEGEDYQSGIKLLELYAPKNPFLPIVSKSNNSWSRGKLKELLFALSENTKPIIERTTAESNAVPASPIVQPVKVKTIGNPNDLHPHLQKLHNEQIQPLYRQRGYLHATLRHLGDGSEEARELSLQIVEIRHKLTPLLARIDHWKEKGELSETDLSELNKTTFGEWKETFSKIQTANQYISRNKKYPDKQTAKRQELEKLKKQLSDLETKLHSCGLI